MDLGISTKEQNRAEQSRTEQNKNRVEDKVQQSTTKQDRAAESGSRSAPGKRKRESKIK